MRVLVACEESQEVCKAFRKLGHRAFSCDLVECSGGHPEWHIIDDVSHILNGDCHFFTSDGFYHYVSNWDLIIAHPPCTYLSSAGACRLFNADHSIKDESRLAKGFAARLFFLNIFNADCPRIAVENPVPLKYFELPPYTQIIEPYQFGDPWKKRTCLWLKNLRPLVPTNIVEPTGRWTVSGGGPTCRIKLKGKGGATSQRERSRTFPGIASAMAQQWGSRFGRLDF